MTATSPTLDALLRAVIASPAEDLPRLVYSDALEESGEPGDVARAAYIRHAIAHPGYTIFSKSSPVHVSLYDPETRTDSVGLHVDGIDGVSFVTRRGFVCGVRTTLATWRGSACGTCGEEGTLIGDPECESCRGAGRVHDPDSEYVDATMDCDNCDRIDCPACHGTGRVGGVGARIVRTHPVERVEVTDREPFNMTGTLSWEWFRGPETSIERHGLPAGLFDHLPGMSPPRSGLFRFSAITRAAALDALSAALLAEARDTPPG